MSLPHRLSLTAILDALCNVGCAVFDAVRYALKTIANCFCASSICRILLGNKPIFTDSGFIIVVRTVDSVSNSTSCSTHNSPNRARDSAYDSTDLQAIDEIPKRLQYESVISGEVRCRGHRHTVPVTVVTAPVTPLLLSFPIGIIMAVWRVRS